MTKLNIDGKIISVPESWTDVTIKQQLQVERLAKDNPDFKSLAIIAGYCGIDILEVKRMSLQDIKGILDKLGFINSPQSKDPIHEFEFKGVKYSIMRTLLKSEFQDFLSLETVIQNHKDNLYNALPTIVAILAKKEGESLDQFDIEERAKLFQELPITIAHRVYVFFCLVAMMSSTDSHKMLAHQDRGIQELLKNMNDTLTRPASGGLLMRLLKVTLRSYLKFLKRKWKRFYSGLPLEAGKQN
jgi:hypothetical protein